MASMATIESTKRCYKCGGLKALSEFYKDARTPTGRKYECKACFNAMGKSYAQANKERVNARSQAWRDANRETFRQSSRRSWHKHKVQRCADAIKWKKANPDHWRALQQSGQRNYKARKRNAEGRHGPEDINAIYRAQNGLCAICRNRLRDRFHVDHIIPLSKEGTNWPTNLQVLCPSCNMSKNDSDPVEYMQSRGFLL